MWQALRKGGTSTQIFFSIFLAKHEVYLFSFNMNYNLPIQITVTTTIEPLDTSPVRNSFSWKSTLKFNVYSPRND